MAFFKDGTGQEWAVQITTGTLRRAKNSSAGAGLIAATGPKGDWKQMVDDPVALGETLWLLCEKQATERGYNPDTFADLFNGETLEKATLALLEAVTDFSQPSLATKMNEKANETMRLAVAKANQRISELDPESLISALGLAGQSESTQSPGPSANS